MLPSSAALSLACQASIRLLLSPLRQDMQPHSSGSSMHPAQSAVFKATTLFAAVQLASSTAFLAWNLKNGTRSGMSANVDMHGLSRCPSLIAALLLTLS